MSDPRVQVHPGIRFGRPHTTRRGITTAVIADRWRAGESAAHLAEDYDLTTEEVEAALAFERWCRRRGRYDAPYAERLASRELGAPVSGGWPRQVWPRRER